MTALEATSDWIWVTAGHGLLALLAVAAERGWLERLPLLGG
jgi:hypothetical protein